MKVIYLIILIISFLVWINSDNFGKQLLFLLVSVPILLLTLGFILNYLSNTLRKDIIKKLPAEFNCCYWFDLNKQGGIILDSCNGAIALWKSFGLPVKNYSISKILEVKLNINETTITYSTKQGAISRAVVGGLLFGGAGALVGATSAKETAQSIQRPNSITLELVIDDVAEPIWKYEFLKVSRGKSEHELPSVVIEKINHQARFICTLIEISLSGIKYDGIVDSKRLDDLIRLFEARAKALDCEEKKLQLFQDMIKAEASNSKTKEVSLLIQTA